MQGKSNSDSCSSVSELEYDTDSHTVGKCNQVEALKIRWYIVIFGCSKNTTKNPVVWEPSKLFVEKAKTATKTHNEQCKA